ncbi:hypothetical protein LCGC14_3153060, partial [marine sediment metagenome]
ENRLNASTEKKEVKAKTLGGVEIKKLEVE